MSRSNINGLISYKLRNNKEYNFKYNKMKENNTYDQP